MKILVGHTGFVGSNLENKFPFDGLYNSKNIDKAFGLNPDVLVYSGVRAEKFLANKNPEDDFRIIENAIENIKKINPKKIILISTVDVYPDPVHVHEDTIIPENPQAYGRNRLYLEKWVEENFTDYLIVRLPALFGKNIKKNFIYDIISFIPAMLSAELYNKFTENIRKNYTLGDNGFYKLNILKAEEQAELKKQFKEAGFSALNFTDSRGSFQFYNLGNLWKDIQTADEAGIKKINLATEPVSVKEIYSSVFNEDFQNELSNTMPVYDFYTNHAGIYGKQGHYIAGKDEVLKDIVSFIKAATV